jgi:hypothetical protein
MSQNTEEGIAAALRQRLGRHPTPKELLAEIRRLFGKANPK